MIEANLLDATAILLQLILKLLKQYNVYNALVPITSLMSQKFFLQSRRCRQIPSMQQHFLSVRVAAQICRSDSQSVSTVASCGKFCPKSTFPFARFFLSSVPSSAGAAARELTTFRRLGARHARSRVIFIVGSAAPRFPFSIFTLRACTCYASDASTCKDAPAVYAFLARNGTVTAVTLC